MSTLTKPERLARANAFIAFIANTGTRKFRHAGVISQFALNSHSVIFIQGDVLSGRRSFAVVHLNMSFRDGPLMLDLVWALYDYIRHGDWLTSFRLGPFPQWRDGGDPWGYGADMPRVRDEAQRLGLCEVQLLV